MASEAEAKTQTTTADAGATPAQSETASNPAAVKKAIALGKDVQKQSEKTKRR